MNKVTLFCVVVFLVASLAVETQAGLRALKDKFRHKTPAANNRVPVHGAHGSPGVYHEPTHGHPGGYHDGAHGHPGVYHHGTHGHPGGYHGGAGSAGAASSAASASAGGFGGSASSSAVASAVSAPRAPSYGYHTYEPGHVEPAALRRPVPGYGTGW